MRAAKIRSRKENNSSYSLAWGYLKESKKHILSAVALFLFSVILGMTFQPPEIVEMLQKFIQELLEDTSALGFFNLFLYIFNNNLQSSFFSLFSGILFGIFPVLASVANGYLIGFVADKVIISGGALELWRLVPHGIFELPALFISLGLGIKLGGFVFSRNIKKEFFRRLKESLRVFILVILPLLIIAGIIEAGLIIVLG